MNKILTWLPALLVIGTIAYKPVKEATENKLTEKNVTFSVYKSSPYTSAVYTNTSAQLHVTIEKVSASGHHTIVWDKTYEPESLSTYPSLPNAFNQTVNITNLNEKKEYLVIHYTLNYNSKGSELLMHEASVVKGDNTAKVNISI
jgi:hypothetical protein